MLTRFETIFVRIAIFVLPAPRWAALMIIMTVVKTMPPMMTWKYSTAASCVSSAEPAKRMIGSAKATQTTLIIAVRITVMRMHMRRICTALSRFFSPRRRATSAEIAVLIAMNTAMPMNFGCCVRPTAAIA